MTSRRRIAAAGLAAVAAIALGTILLILRYGRPLFYSDGQDARAGAGLSQASMLEFGEPQVLTELPGEVVGRVAVLPDGRWIYGARSKDGDVDLVAFDPERPGLPPEPLVGLNSAGFDLAPAMGPGPAVYFASDRAGGEGGMDLYRSAWRQGSFGPVEALRAGINTGADETDPAPAPAGPQADHLVFVRQEPGQSYARLFHGGLSAESVCEPLFPASAEPALHALVRDPIFGSDGRSLYFVRQGRHGVRLLRTASHGGRFLEPWSPAGLEADRAWRSPLPGPRGLGLTLLHEGDPALLYRSEAQERLVYWEGQRGLERFLLVGLLTSVLLVLLIALGGRWSQLDLITRLLLLSLLIHGLVLLVMSRVDILMDEESPAGDEGTIEVQILSEDPGSEAGEGRTEFQPARELAFEPAETELPVQGPSSRLAENRMAGPEPRRGELAPLSATDPAIDRDREVLVDGADAPKPRSVREDLAGLSEPRQDLTAQTDHVDRPSADRTGSRQAPVLPVPVPRSAVRASGVGAAEAARTSRRSAMPAPDRTEVDAGVRTLALGDAPATPGHRSVPEAPGALQDHQAPLTDPAANVDPTASAVEVAGATAPLRVQPPRTEPPRIEDPDPRRLGGRGRGDRASPAEEVLALQTPGERPVALADAVRASDRQPVAVARPADDEQEGTLEGVVQPLTSPGTAATAAATATALTRPQRTTGGQRAPLAALETPGSSLANPARRRHARSSLADSANRGSDALEPVAAEVDVADALSTEVGPARGRPDGRERRRPGKEAASILRPSRLAALGPARVPLAGEALRPQAESSVHVDGDRQAEPLPVPGSQLASAPRRRHDSRIHEQDLQPGVFRNRFGAARIEALRRFGGTQETEAAVRDGLAYLARMQQDDGSWGSKGKIDRKYGETFVGKTALCLLAFLGAGHVPGKRQKHSKVARDAMEFLLYVQDQETGHFGLTSAYSHGISTYALAECYALTREARLRAPLTSAVTWILENQNASRDRTQDGGWGYYSPTLRREDAYARTSVSSWQVMALLSAQKAGLEIPRGALVRAQRFFSNNYDRRRGYFLYSREPGRLRSQWRTLPASTPASVFSLLLLGEKSSSARVQGGLAFTLERRPRRYGWRGDDAFVRKAEGNTYFWYYGSLACFLAGGETWKQWNRSLVEVLPRAQQGDGSFAALGPYAAYAGDGQRDRSYTTAMCVLSLEVYYRYFTPLLQGR